MTSWMDFQKGFKNSSEIGHATHIIERKINNSILRFFLTTLMIWFSWKTCLRHFFDLNQWKLVSEIYCNCLKYWNIPTNQYLAYFLNYLNSFSNIQEKPCGRLIVPVSVFVLYRNRTRDTQRISRWESKWRVYHSKLNYTNYQTNVPKTYYLVPSSKKSVPPSERNYFEIKVHPPYWHQDGGCSIIFYYLSITHKI